MQDAEHASGSCVVKSQCERFGFDECCENEDLEGLEAAYKAAIEADGCIHTMEDENTLLMHQAGSSLPVLRKLVELGEDPMKLNGLDESVMHMCARWNYPEAVRFFAGLGVPVDGVDMLRLTPLMAACRAEFPTLEVVKELLSLGASPNPLESGLAGPLHVLSMGREWEAELVSLLVDGGARVNQPLATGLSPLACSLENSPGLSIDIYPHARVTHALLVRGAVFDWDANQYARQFEQAAILAARQDHVELLHLLNEEHCELKDVVSERGETLLHHAVAKNAVAATLALLELGVDPRQRNHAGALATEHADAGPACVQVIQSFLARQQAYGALAASVLRAPT